ncbi:nuclear transport factor 2 family protein [Mycobacterium sp. 2YAF39]|uniref:nuclear transport factor 2 family protein n=1 Tax=Mycobacterium sp. 2YAF39 TaxID=3233033 RepID=UPI003F9E47B8
MIDEQEIRSLVNRYADAASRRDPSGIAGTFATNGTWQAPELGCFEGHDAMSAFFTAMLDGWNVFLQALMSGVVVVDVSNPDRALGRWFVQETGQRAEGTNLIISGVYHDEYIRDEGAWLILHRRYDALLRNTDGQVATLPFPSDVPAIG